MYKQRNRIYLDFATATPVDRRVKKAMEQFWSTDFGNPNSLHHEGVSAKKALDSSRKNVAKIFNAKPEEIIFTSGGTESNNLAIFGIVNKLFAMGARYSDLHVITSKIEHSSVLECFRQLQKLGVQVDIIGVDGDGRVDPNLVEQKIKSNTVLVSVMYANNEIGTIQPVRKIAQIIKAKRSMNKKNGKGDVPILHSDASQAPEYLDINRDKLEADLITIDGQKIYGPKGVGALYMSKGMNISPIFFGGGQEKSIRPGTENIPLIVGFAKALELCILNRDKEYARIKRIRDYFWERLIEKFPTIITNGSISDRLPNNINFSYPGLDAELAVIRLDALGVSCSTKSACLEGEEDSYVIRALGGGADRSKTSLRFSLGRFTLKKEIDLVVAYLERVLPLARQNQ